MLLVYIAIITNLKHFIYNIKIVLYVDQCCQLKVFSFSFLHKFLIF
jgi:hypothetical protein